MSWSTTFTSRLRGGPCRNLSARGISRADGGHPAASAIGLGLTAVPVQATSFSDRRRFSQKGLAVPPCFTVSHGDYPSATESRNRAAT